MALTTNLPPQAYTRDTLVKAIEWLSSQPSSMRERATSADLVVSYYLQARRRQTVQMEAPVSCEHFKTDLKDLAKGLKQFESSPLHPSAPPQAAVIPPSGSSPSFFSERIAEIKAKRSAVEKQPEQLHLMPHPEAPVAATPPEPEPVSTPIAASVAPTSTPEVAPSAALPALNPWDVDVRSREAAAKLQDRLNLSSESEALRLLITLGAERARELFP